MDTCPYCQGYIGDVVQDIVKDHYAVGVATVIETCPECERELEIEVFIDIQVHGVNEEDGLGDDDDDEPPF